MGSVDSTVIRALITALGVILIGFAKAGFGGGVGFLTTPLLSLFMLPRFVIGVLLPLLIIADAFVVWIYHRHFARRQLLWLLLGASVGIGAAAIFVDRVDEVVLRRTIGAIALAFVALQQLQSRIGEGNFSLDRWELWLGLLAGAVAGFVSMISHSAGVIVAMYLLPQGLDKRSFVGTMVLFFAVVNLAKVVPYLKLGLINPATLSFGLPFVVFIPVGIWLGRKLNERMRQETFRNVILVLVLLAGINLLLERNLIDLLLGR